MSLFVNESEATVTAGSLDSDSSSDEEDTLQAVPHRSGNVSAVLDDGTHYACVRCGEPRLWEATAHCDVCGRTTESVIGWDSNGTPYETSAWECGACHSVVYRLPGGNDESNGHFRQYCDECNADRDFIWSDNRVAFCCAQCRWEKDEPVTDADGEKYWSGWCASCDEETNTEKVDEAKDNIICCSDCRLDQNCDHGGVWECSNCDEEQRMQDINA